MAATVLNTRTAVEVSIHVIRAFVGLRNAVGVQQRSLVHRLDRLEAKYDGQFKVVFDAIRQLMLPPDSSKRRRIGFV